MRAVFLQWALASSCFSSGSVAMVFFAEEFDNGWDQRWILTTTSAKGERRGSWHISAGKAWVKNATADQGLMTGEDMAFFAASADMGPFSNAGSDLIIQYQVKYDQDPNCGGAYLKLGPRMSDPDHFGDQTPFYIMFGPDVCGATSRRTHLIFTYNGRAELKEEDLPYKQDFGATHLYRMTLRPNNTVRVDIDQDRIYEGNLAVDWGLPDDPLLYMFQDIGFIGFDLWQLKGGTIFDNIIVTDDPAEADDFAHKWRILHNFEALAISTSGASNQRGEK